ncbi:energy-coupling factor transport system ATP-binding protein [Desulfitispora alkaliphila]|uniref:energy-coupling factor transporter ATPase n=1 Tax=Desulfitispora alkaliphila TaxID=622674 RepID=UPI003D1F0922
MSIKLKNVSHTYLPETPQAVDALKDINLEIPQGQLLGIMGHTGSGKSTLIQLLNGLIKPTEGKVQVGSTEITEKKSNMKTVRQKVGLVFQYPEHQLFEDTVYNDIAFAPRNLGCKVDEVDRRVKASAALVQLDLQEIGTKSPLALSGGQKRRVAIAGVLAMKPQVLILDEPTAGLDPRGRNDILKQIKRLHEKENITVIIVSHSMEELAELVQRLIVMLHGEIVIDGSPTEVFTRAEELKKCGLEPPVITKLMIELGKKGHQVSNKVFTVQDAQKELCRVLGVSEND